MRIGHIGPMRHIVLAASALAAFGCASGPATVNVNVPPTSTVSSIVIVNTSNVTKPVDIQANGNDLSYAAAGGAAGLAVGIPAGNPEAGLALGMLGGLAVKEVKDAAFPSPSAKSPVTPRFYLMIPTTSTPPPAAAGAKGGDANGARGNPPGG